MLVLMKRVFAGICVVLCWADAAAAQGAREPIVASDLLKIKQVGGVRASPDGRFVAYTVQSIVADTSQAYVYRTQIWIVGASGTEPPWQLTYGESGATAPAWHPDSERLIFVRQSRKRPQLFEISVYGGEARQLTDFEHGVSSPVWAPDGRQIMFSASLTREEVEKWTEMAPTWSDERPGRLRSDHMRADPDPDGSLDGVRAWLSENEEASDPRMFTRLNLQGELQLEPEPSFRHYFIADMEVPDAPRFQMITSGHYSYSDAVWLPDSRQVIVAGYPEESGHPDWEQDRDLYLIDVATRRKQRLLDISGYRLSAPVVSPSGNFIAFSARDLEDLGYAQTEIGIFALDGRTPPEMLTLDFDRSARDVQWSHDNWFIYFTAPSGGGVPLFRVEVDRETRALPTPQEELEADTLAADSLITAARDSFLKGELVRRGPPVTQLTPTEQGIRNYDITSATAYTIVTQVLNPYELYASTMDFGAPRRLSSHNESWLRNKALSIPSAHNLQSADGEIGYWVMPPTFQQQNRTYPLMVAIHGGPAAMWGPGEATMWHEFQFMAAKGYGIAYSNPRGSGGYGNAWRRANYQDWGNGPATDVLAVASEVATRHRWVDSDKQVVTGGSYAGYLTAWIVTQDHRFKAAVAQRGVYDLTTFFGEGNAWRLIPNHFGGYPWENGPLLRANSPITYVDLIRTPLLIIHADNDFRTGVIQSEVLYKSLKVLGKPVEYVRYPEAGHDLSRTGNPKQRMDRILRIWEFMERYAGTGR